MATTMTFSSSPVFMYFLAALFLFIYGNLGMVTADSSGVLHEEEAVILDTHQQDAQDVHETVPETELPAKADALLSDLTETALEESKDTQTNITEQTNSSTPVDYYQILATYMRPEVFETFIKGLNKTLDRSTQYAHPDFTYADAPESKHHRKVKYPCLRRPAGNRTAEVRIVNSTELMQVVESYKPASQDNSSSVLGGYCTFVMFYAPWCKFSAAAAPGFNAIGRAFPDLEVLAMDAFQYNSLNTLYGIVAVPNILLFHKNKPVMRFNYSERTFDVLSNFIKNFTGLEPNSSVEVTPSDYEGPLPSVATEEPDYALWLSWLLLVIVGIWFLKQRLGSALVDRMRTFTVYARQVWRTGEFYDQVGVLVHEHHE